MPNDMSNAVKISFINGNYYVPNRFENIAKITHQDKNMKDNACFLIFLSVIIKICICLAIASRSHSIPLEECLILEKPYTGTQ